MIKTTIIAMAALLVVSVSVPAFADNNQIQQDLNQLQNDLNNLRNNAQEITSSLKQQYQDRIDDLRVQIEASGVRHFEHQLDRIQGVLDSIPLAPEDPVYNYEVSLHGPQNGFDYNEYGQVDQFGILVRGIDYTTYDILILYNGELVRTEQFTMDNSNREYRYSEVAVDELNNGDIVTVKMKSRLTGNILAENQGIVKEFTPSISIKKYHYVSWNDNFYVFAKGEGGPKNPYKGELYVNGEKKTDEFIPKAFGNGAVSFSFAKELSVVDDDTLHVKLLTTSGEVLATDTVTVNFEN